MGRLENFIPKLEQYKIIDGEALQFSGQAPIPLEANVIPFIKQINGHLSLKEIFLFLNSKGEFFSISQSLAILHHLANKKFLINNEDYFNLTTSELGTVKKTVPKKQIPESFFSEERLISLIQKTTLFLECDRSTAKSILAQSTLENVPEATRLIETGTRSPYFYVLLAGEAGVYWQDECLATLGNLSIFGESAAIFDRVRNADVVATENSWVLKIDASKIVDTNSPETFDAFKGLKSRLILNQTLSANPLFQSLPADIMQFFISKCRIEKWGKEQTIIEQDETSGDFYFMLSGSVAVIKDGMPVTSLSEGDHFGEVAALLNEPRTASIISETACTFLVLNQSSLFKILCSHFRLAIDIENTAKERKNSSGNILGIFEDSNTSGSEVSENLDFSTATDFKIDPDFLEVTHTNFDLEVVDFSNSGDKAS